MKGLSSRVALVTGADGGIGFAAAKRLASEGANVALSDINAQGLERAIESIGSASSARVIGIQTDVSNREQVLDLARRVRDELGPVNILVNAAGILELGGILDISEEQWDRMLAVNLKGPFLVTQAVLEGMIGSGYGRVINISSNAGKKGGMHSGVHYGASKGGLLAFTKSLARYVAQFGMTANCVCPSLTDTDMASAFTPEVRQAMADENPFKRLAKPEEIASAIAFLASEEAAFINAEMLDVDGGFIAD